jgi:hypothetical protein
MELEPKNNLAHKVQKQISSLLLWCPKTESTFFWQTEFSPEHRNRSSSWNTLFCLEYLHDSKIQKPGNIMSDIPLPDPVE